MKENDIVNIYQEPFKKEGFEGRAMLMKRIYKFDELERWYVKFLDFKEFALCRRNIVVRSLVITCVLATTQMIT